MVELIKPNPDLHEYVIGIDFGHGETSAAYCRLEWGKSAGQSDIDAYDILVEGNKVLVSAIKVVDGDERPIIGKYVFQSKKEGTVRIGFKEPPVNINGEKEVLMIQYMKAVYDSIKAGMDELTDTNHIVYLARPSGWHKEKAQEVYMEMAKKAGIPLGGLTSESRAALFSALHNPKDPFIKKTEKGAVVVDLGSSTLDFTYYAKKQEPIDAGFPNGASKVEEIIFEDKILLNSGIQELLEKYPQYKDVLLFKAREIKEELYKQDDNCGIFKNFNLKNIIDVQYPDFERFKDIKVEVDYNTKDEFHQLINRPEHQYLDSLKKKLSFFKDNYLEDKKIYGIFLTGGASRMGFVKDKIMEVYGLSDEQVHRDENPSLTISRGIAMLGRADCVTKVLREELKEIIKEDMEKTDVYKEFVIHLSEQLKDGVWGIISLELSRFKISSTDLSVADLESNIRTAFYKYSLVPMKTTFYDSLRHIMVGKSGKIRSELFEIINNYSPGAEIDEIYIKYVALDISTTEHQLKKLTDRIVDMLIEQVSDDIFTDIMKYLLGVAYPIYEVAKKIFNLNFKTEEERRREKEKKKKKTLKSDKREKCYNAVMKKGDRIKDDMFKKLQTSLLYNEQLKNEFEPIIEKQIKEFIHENIESVCIPIN